MSPLVSPSEGRPQSRQAITRGARRVTIPHNVDICRRASLREHALGHAEAVTLQLESAT